MHRHSEQVDRLWLVAHGAKLCPAWFHTVAFGRTTSLHASLILPTYLAFTLIALCLLCSGAFHLAIPGAAASTQRHGQNQQEGAIQKVLCITSVLYVLSAFYDVVQLLLSVQLCVMRVWSHGGCGWQRRGGLHPLYTSCNWMSVPQECFGVFDVSFLSPNAACPRLHGESEGDALLQIISRPTPSCWFGHSRHLYG